MTCLVTTLNNFVHDITKTSVSRHDCSRFILEFLKQKRFLMDKMENKEAKTSKSENNSSFQDTILVHFDKNGTTGCDIVKELLNFHMFMKCEIDLNRKIIEVTYVNPKIACQVLMSMRALNKYFVIYKKSIRDVNTPIKSLINVTKKDDHQIKSNIIDDSHLSSEDFENLNIKEKRPKSRTSNIIQKNVLSSSVEENVPSKKLVKQQICMQKDKNKVTEKTEKTKPPGDKPSTKELKKKSSKRYVSKNITKTDKKEPDNSIPLTKGNVIKEKKKVFDMSKANMLYIYGYESNLKYIQIQNIFRPFSCFYVKMIDGSIPHAIAFFQTQEKLNLAWNKVKTDLFKMSKTNISKTSKETTCKRNGRQSSSSTSKCSQQSCDISGSVSDELNEEEQRIFEKFTNLNNVDYWAPLY